MRISRKAFSPGRRRRLRRTTRGRAVVGPEGRLLEEEEERRDSASSRGRARPRRGSLRERRALAGGFARAIVVYCCEMNGDVMWATAKGMWLVERRCSYGGESRESAIGN